MEESGGGGGAFLPSLSVALFVPISTRAGHLNHLCAMCALVRLWRRRKVNFERIFPAMVTIGIEIAVRRSISV